MDSASAAEPNTSHPVAFPHRRWKNHPCAGVDFPDITSSTSDARWMRLACDGLAAHLDSKIDLLAGIDIGGLGLAGALALRNALGFIDIRKVGSIRADVVRSLTANYELGNGIALSKGHALVGRHVAIIDDCLMTGGTALATAQLLDQLGARCTQALFVFELEGLGGRERLGESGVAVHSLERLPPVQPE
ncbi:phosphoribosyltransferase family protein [Bosea sp. (in: a-proteobacteria)]|uniref:phosphoribosyltransferase family protein n=1 Tax=Bosea sp. (in: a-proteobacteria) TaxID=1871050 RepID=UPI0011FCBB3E|nr:phosphoribosyltransferase family protein [Bosea sp. (in: a-proteobacteria)]TAJ27006.1 MAG: adenine phosphoribosyltransferase [Bosea sp. (in: a-proteobacteria)]